MMFGMFSKVCIHNPPLKYLGFVGIKKSLASYQNKQTVTSSGSGQKALPIIFIGVQRMELMVMTS